MQQFVLHVLQMFHILFTCMAYKCIFNLLFIIQFLIENIG